MKSSLQAVARFHSANNAAVDAILANPERYGGEESLMVRWARLWLANRQPEMRGTRRVA